MSDITKIECLTCGYIGEPNTDGEDEDEIVYCPECGSMYIAVLDSKETEE